MKVKQITKKEDAQKASEFLVTPNGFTDITKWGEAEVEDIRTAPFRALNEDNYFAFMLSDENGEVIGYIDACEQPFKYGGYIMRWLAVHKDHLRKGYGSMLNAELERFLKEKKARFILLETGDIDFYIPAWKFYESQGYKQVGHVPDYFFEGWGKYDYFKKLI